MRGRPVTDLTGNVFNRWTVVRFDRTDGDQTYWVCRCECGNEAVVSRDNLRKGHSKSCGCYKSDIQRARMTIHGLSGTPTYKVWEAMLDRCVNCHNEHFDDYGGRGIEVCDRWLSYPNFLEDMGEKPVGLTIDREDNDGNYEPGNCRWATRKTQANNRRNTIYLTLDGTRLSLSEWAAKLGISIETLRSRRRYGWTVEAILSSEVQK